MQMNTGIEVADIYWSELGEELTPHALLHTLVACS